MPDIELTCLECHQPFPFTEEEQAYCAENAFSQPTYCPECHQRRKAARDEAHDRQRAGRRRHRR